MSITKRVDKVAISSEFLVDSKKTEYFKWEQYKTASNLKRFDIKNNGLGSPKTVTKLSSTYLQALDLFYDMKRSDKKFKKFAVEGLELSSSRNKEVYSNSWSEDNASWKGGSFLELKEKPDTKQFKEFQSKLKQSTMYKKLHTVFHHANIRKRQMSEHDGEYDHDRRYDVKPFQRACKGVSPVRKLTLNAHLSFSSGIGSDTINKYGAMVAAICNLLESYGILVEINMISTGRGSVQGQNSDEQLFEDTILIKEPNQYLPITSLLGVFSSNFLRRVEFTRIALDAELSKVGADCGLGRPGKFTKEIDFEKGVLNIYSHSMMEENRQTEFLTNIEKALGLAQ